MQQLALLELGQHRCSACNVIKALSYFARSRLTPSGYYNHCRECKTAKARRHRAKVKQHPEWEQRLLASRREINRKSARKRRLRVLAHYSNGTLACACCGETAYEFLSIDHINGGGRKHHQELQRRGMTVARELIEQGFPSGFRVLCMNCNWARGKFGRCPHEIASVACTR